MAQLMSRSMRLRTSARVTIAPHASYPFSGAVAAAALSALQIPPCWIILGTNHTGVGPVWSVMPDGIYRTPLGDVPIDAVFADELLARCAVVEADETAHRGEHAIEVQLPFLQWQRPTALRIIPIITKSEDPETCRQVAQAIAELVRSRADSVGVLISSDLSHYESHAVAVAKDAALLQAIHAVDADRFLRCVREQSVRMCGTGAIACGLWIAALLGIRQAATVRYGTSAEAGGDPDSVTGFAGVVFP
jgi:AmmeMemoRadiSam system protein B